MSLPCRGIPQLLDTHCTTAGIRHRILLLSRLVCRGVGALTLGGHYSVLMTSLYRPAFTKGSSPLLSVYAKRTRLPSPDWGGKRVRSDDNRVSAPSDPYAYPRPQRQAPEIRESQQEPPRQRLRQRR